MNVDPRKLDRFDKLIHLGEKVLDTKFSIHLGDFGRHDQVDDAASYEWGIKCLSILEEFFGKGSLYYSEFKNSLNGFSTLRGYEQSKRAFAILKTAKEDYENGYISKQIPEVISPTDQSHNIIENLTNKCELEANRNTRIYLITIFIILAVAISCFFYFFGVNLSLVTFTLLIIGYILSTLFLKEWSITKIQERILEHEKERIYKRFDIDSK